MSLFDNLEEKEEEKILIFGQEKEEENNGTGASEGTGTGTTGGSEGTTGGSEGTTGGSEGTGTGTGGSEGRTGGTTGGIEGAETGTATGLFQLTIANSDIESNNDNGPNTSSDFTTATGLNQSTNAKESFTQEKSIKRPSFLNFGSTKKEEKEEEKAKDIKIKKSSGKRKKGEIMSEEQVEVIFCSLFDGIALFRGNHWRVTEQEKHIIPSLSRILNRILDSLPKGVSENAFNIMDYVIVLGAIGGMVLTRIKAEKEEDYYEEIGDRTVGIQNGIETNSRELHEPIIPDGKQSKRNENGVSSLAPIKDLAKSISSIR